MDFVSSSKGFSKSCALWTVLGSKTQVMEAWARDMFEKLVWVSRLMDGLPGLFRALTTISTLQREMWNKWSYNQVLAD